MGKIGFWGDNTGDRVIAFDIEAFKPLATISVGDGPYPVDRVNDDLIFVSTRNERSVSTIDIKSLNRGANIQLAHTPRSSTLQSKTGRVLVAGGDTTLTTIFDVSGSWPKTIGTYGPGSLPTVFDHGGSLASGHPDWLDETGDRFFVLDRIMRRIHVYDLSSPTPIWSQNLPSSAHDVFQYPGENALWYAVCEGSSSHLTPPSLVEIKETKLGFQVTRNLFLPVDPTHYDLMGGHHCDKHPNGTHIYFGSNEGVCYVIDRHKISVETTLQTGKAHGHTRFDENRDIAITTNHNDDFVSIIDSKAHKLIKNIQVAFDPKIGKQKLQGHTSTISADGNYFVHTASNDGAIYRLDLDKLDVADREIVGGYPIQGTTFVATAAAQSHAPLA